MLSPTACNRPFADVRNMDESLIRAWNAVVKPDDVVYHLGDFAMSLHDGDRVRSIFSRLMGRKFLILGNHDYQRQNRIHPVIASLEWDQRPTQQLEVTDGGERVFLSHYPSVPSSRSSIGFRAMTMEGSRAFSPGGDLRKGMDLRSRSRRNRFGIG